MQRLYKRGSTWYGWYYENGRRIFRSTQCRDRNAAEAKFRQWERDAADPDHAAARTATLTDALRLLFQRDEEEIAAGRRSADTLDFHRVKAGHLVRVFETDEHGQYVGFLLARLRPRDVDGYVSRRRAEGAGEGTIAKELSVLRKSLRFSVRAGLWRGRVEEVLPVGFSPNYEPRKRALTVEEARRLVAELAPGRAARVAFILATSACWRETDLARNEDVSADRAEVLIRGTKRKTRFRPVPIVTPAQRSLLDFALEYATGEGGVLFAPWGNVRRDLLAACRRARIAPCSPNDLRRTFSSWMVEAGIQLYPIAQMMGHKDTRMLERVYGRQSTEQLRAAVERPLGLLPEHGPSVRCNAFVTATLESAGLSGRNGLEAEIDSGAPEMPKNIEAPQTSQSAGPLDVGRVGVPGPGIEPGTRGFSVPCSTI